MHEYQSGEFACGCWGLKDFRFTNEQMDIEDKEKENNTWSSLPSDHFNYRYYGDLPLMTTLTVTAITRIVHLISIYFETWYIKKL